MSPYAVSKVFGDHLTRNYFHSYGVKTVVSRTFNHEGAGRGVEFVTAVIARQVARLVAGETRFTLDWQCQRVPGLVPYRRCHPWLLYSCHEREYMVMSITSVQCGPPRCCRTFS